MWCHLGKNSAVRRWAVVVVGRDQEEVSQARVSVRAARSWFEGSMRRFSERWVARRGRRWRVWRELRKEGGRIGRSAVSVFGGGRVMGKD